jgi:hypothetical protein
MGSLITHRRKSGVFEPVQFIFDEQGREGLKVREFWNYFRYAAFNDELERMIPNEPKFEDDMDMLPLQAADLYSWQIRNVIDSEKNPNWANEMRVLNTIDHITTVFDEARCHQHIAAVERFR